MTHIPDSPKLTESVSAACLTRIEFTILSELNIPFVELANEAQGNGSVFPGMKQQRKLLKNGLKSKKSMDLRQLRNMLSLVDMCLYDQSSRLSPFE